MSHPNTEGWELISSVKEHCLECQWVVTEHHLAACEYGERGFPAAKFCYQFKAKDDE